MTSIVWLNGICFEIKYWWAQKDLKYNALINMRFFSKPNIYVIIMRFIYSSARWRVLWNLNKFNQLHVNMRDAAQISTSSHTYLFYFSESFWRDYSREIEKVIARCLFYVSHCDYFWLRVKFLLNLIKSKHRKNIYIHRMRERC
jgi:hypothetical protein